MTIQYLVGDATSPVGDGNKIIVHVCNDIGKWGKGFVIAVSKRWEEPEQVYKASFKSEPKPQLGEVQFVKVSSFVTIANLIGQHGVRSPRNKTAPAPIRYEAVSKGLGLIGEEAEESGATVHMPRIGCGLAGGEWSEIEKLIDQSLGGLDVYVYDFG